MLLSVSCPPKGYPIYSSPPFCFMTDVRTSRSTWTCDPARTRNGVRPNVQEWFHPRSLTPTKTTVSSHTHSIKIHFKDPKGELIKTIEGNEGDDILSLAHEHDVDLEGACEGSIACSTCHVVLSPQHYDMLDEPGDDENDMLDMAFGLTDTSRLGCQVRLERKLDGMVCTLPAATRNMFVDGESRGPCLPPLTAAHRRRLTFVSSRQKTYASLNSLDHECSLRPLVRLDLQPCVVNQGTSNRVYLMKELNTTLPPLRSRKGSERSRRL